MRRLKTPVGVVLKIAPNVVLGRQTGQCRGGGVGVGIDGAALLASDDRCRGLLHLVEEGFREKAEGGGLLGFQAAVRLNHQVAQRQGEPDGEYQDQPSQ